MYARLDASIAARTLSGLALVGCLRYAAHVKVEEEKERQDGLGKFHVRRKHVQEKMRCTEMC